MLEMGRKTLGPSQRPGMKRIVGFIFDLGCEGRFGLGFERNYLT